MIYYEQKWGVHSSALISVLWMALVAYGALKMFTLILQATELVILNIKCARITFEN